MVPQLSEHRTRSGMHIGRVLAAEGLIAQGSQGGDTQFRPVAPQPVEQEVARVRIRVEVLTP
jgi:hypothetical protein